MCSWKKSIAPSTELRRIESKQCSSSTKMDVRTFLISNQTFELRKEAKDLYNDNTTIKIYRGSSRKRKNK